MGSLLTGFVEGMLPMMTNDRASDVQLGADVFDQGLNNVVKDMDMSYAPEWRLSKGNGMKGMVAAAKPKAGTVAGKPKVRKASKPVAKPAGKRVKK